MMGKVQIKPSKIHGRGLFATGPINRGELVLCSWRENDLIKSNEFRKQFEQDEINKFSNHSFNPNTFLVYDYILKAWFKMALKKINAGDEITSNYRDSMKTITEFGYCCDDWMLEIPE